MAKKGRLGSDPLNWIGDSREKESKKKTKSQTSKQRKPKKTEKATNEKKLTKNTKQNQKVLEKNKKVATKATDSQIEIKRQPGKVIEKKQPREFVKTPTPLDKNQAESQSIGRLNKTINHVTEKAKSPFMTNLEFEGKYLTFVLADEEYGIVITKVKEIIGMLPITRVPRTPDYICGVINLRGKIISIIDLRLKFGMGPTHETFETVIIVVQTRLGEKGIIVDKVSEVLNINVEDIEPVPEFGTSIDTEYILGIGKTGNTIKILLDIEKVLIENTVNIEN